MINNSNHKVHAFLALFLITVFFSTFLVKPVHVLFVHHNLTEKVPIEPDKATISNPTDNDCPICDLEFCFFLSTNQIEIQKVPTIFSEQQTLQTVDCLLNKASQHFQLRAPPVV